MVHPLAETTRREGPRSEARPPAALPHLFVVLECARPAAGGARYGLDGVEEVLVGRGAAREIVRRGGSLALRLPDALASSSHARLRRTDEGWHLEDLGSTNGTFVGGRRTRGELLDDGAAFEVGETLLTVREELLTPAGPPDVDGERLDGRAHGLATLLPDYARQLVDLRAIIASPLPLLLLGESGTGKEVLAQAVHAYAKRKGAFVPVNCGAIPDTLVESQLFGHAKGAFSGALRDEPGFVRASDAGTLFLDEVADLPRSSQAALLRVLQEREVVAVGSTRAVRVDLRVVSATHRPVAALSASDAFRHDLYARLAGFTHVLPPVRERKEDLGLFTAELLARIAPDRAKSLGLTIDLARALYAYDWPLNLRELSHCLSTALVFATDGKLHLRHAPEAVRARARSGPSMPPPAPVAAADKPPAALSDEDARVRDTLAEALVRHRGNVSEIARELGRTRMQIHRWMRRFGMDAASHRDSPAPRKA